MNNIPELPAIGKNLHMERKRQQLSMADLATASGISKAMLSQIESNKVNPTIATLWKIAHALHVDIESIISGEKQNKKRFEVIRKETVITLATDHGDTKFQVLTPPTMVEDLELYRMILEPGCKHLSQPHTNGTEEFLNLLSGKIRVIAGENSTILEPGDFIIVQSDIEHSIENLSTQQSELFMVVRFKCNHIAK